MELTRNLGSTCPFQLLLGQLDLASDGDRHLSRVSQADQVSTKLPSCLTGAVVASRELHMPGSHTGRIPRVGEGREGSWGTPSLKFTCRQVRIERL